MCGDPKARFGRMQAGSLDTNVEFYTAILLGALKIPREAFTPVPAGQPITGFVEQRCPKLGPIQS
ncbi:hypothetical protein Amn_pb01340 (plasmid) [Aminobacter sp. Y103A]|nr:hypothetical protein Amn_pb01340 [Aminobacter sp. SS-2016]